MFAAFITSCLEAAPELNDRIAQPRPSIFIILLYSALFSHEKTGPRRFGSGAEEGESEKNRRPSRFRNPMPETAQNLPHLDIPNFCILKLNFLQLKGHWQRKFLLLHLKEHEKISRLAV
jgi:hypothetical protein